MTNRDDHTSEQDERTTMDEQATETPAADTAAGEATDAEQHAPQADAEQEDAGGNREAARYRKRLRETETERDELLGQIDAMRRAEVERLAAKEIHKPAGIWAAGIEVAELLAEDGTVDPAKVTAAARQAVDSLGLAAPRHNVVPLEGANPRPAPTRHDMVDAVMGRD